MGYKYHPLAIQGRAQRTLKQQGRPPAVNEDKTRHVTKDFKNNNILTIIHKAFSVIILEKTPLVCSSEK